MEDIGDSSSDQQVAALKDNAMSVVNVICALIGMPLNVVIIAFIIARRRLHQPRNIIWAGIAFSNLFILFVHVVELVSVYDPSAVTLCRFRYSLVGLPYVSLLMNHFISLVDRYLSVSYSVWYHRSVTAPLMAGIQLTAFIFLCFFMKLHFIFGIVPVKCNVVHPVDRKVIFGFFLTFLFLCLAGQLTLYIRIRKYLLISDNRQQTTNIEAPKVQENCLSMSIPENQEDNPDDNMTAANAAKALQTRESSSLKNNSHFVKIGDQTVSRLEFEATRNVTLGMCSLLMFATPWIISTILMMICQRNLDYSMVMEECINYQWAVWYTKELLIIHSIYQSIFYLVRSKDFSAALSRR